MSENEPKSQIATISKLFEERRTKLAEVLPRHLSADRLIKVALNCIAKTPKLLECSASSLVQCLATAAELGLEPGGVLGHLYLVPFDDRKAQKTLCTAIIGYKGFIELARRSGQLEQIEAHVVFGGESFQVEYGLNPIFKHVPTLTGERGEPLFVYMLARLKGGAVHVEVMTLPEVNAVRARSRSGEYGPWKTDFLEMARKTVVRRGMKYLPLSPDDRLTRALEVDDEEYDVEGQVVRTALPADTTLSTEIAPGNSKARAALRKMPPITEVLEGGDEVAVEPSQS